MQEKMGEEKLRDLVIAVLLSSFFLLVGATFLQGFSFSVEQHFLSKFHIFRIFSKTTKQKKSEFIIVQPKTFSLHCRNELFYCLFFCCHPFSCVRFLFFFLSLLSFMMFLLRVRVKCSFSRNKFLCVESFLEGKISEKSRAQFFLLSFLNLVLQTTKCFIFLFLLCCLFLSVLPLFHALLFKVLVFAFYF